MNESSPHFRRCSVLSQRFGQLNECHQSRMRHRSSRETRVPQGRILWSVAVKCRQEMLWQRGEGAGHSDRRNHFEPTRSSHCWPFRGGNMKIETIPGCDGLRQIVELNERDRNISNRVSGTSAGKPGGLFIRSPVGSPISIETPAIGSTRTGDCLVRMRSWSAQGVS
jgi:hypothetical protein